MMQNMMVIQMRMVNTMVKVSFKCMMVLFMKDNGLMVKDKAME